MAKRSAAEILEKINPIKSTKRYEDTWNKFIKYTGCLPDKLCEEIFIQYFDYLRNEKQFASSTLWTEYSMLNYKVKILYGQKLQMMPRLTMQLKSYEAGYQRKTSSIFTMSHINKFLESAPNDNSFLHKKAISVISICGGLRCADLVTITCNDLLFDVTTGYWIKYTVSKQINFITNKFNVPLNYSQYITNYCNRLRELKIYESRLWKTYRTRRDGSSYYTSQPMGIHILGKIPIEIAKYLQLPNSESYTGHAFRRSTASAMAESGASTALMRTHFNWKSESTSMKYIESTDTQKLKISDFIQGNNKSISTNEIPKDTSVKNFHFNIQNCHNFVLNMGSELDNNNS